MQLLLQSLHLQRARKCEKTSIFFRVRGTGASSGLSRHGVGRVLGLPYSPVLGVGRVWGEFGASLQIIGAGQVYLLFALGRVSSLGLYYIYKHRREPTPGPILT